MSSTGNQSGGDAGFAGVSSDDGSRNERAAWEAGLLEAAVDSGPRPATMDGAPEVPGYEIIGRLGAGASGEVWLADEVEPGRTVALKILHRDGAAGASVEVLRRELRILAKLVHTNLVALHHGVVTADGRQGLAMEWIDGWPLDEWLRDHPDLTLTEKLELFHGIVRGVAFLHDHGVIHRDLKPANVIVDTRGVAKIVDFGLARLHQQETASGGDGGSIGVSGTLHFMAPEQAANGKGARAMPVDVYALGLMLHRILLGEWLYSPEGTHAETLAQVLNPPPVLRGTGGKKLPQDLRSILRQALAPDPAARYHHARELAADLTRYAAKLPVAARKHTLLYLAGTFLRRQARRSAVAGALVIAGLVASGILYHRHRVVVERNESNLRYAYSLTSFTLRQLASELRTGTANVEDEPTHDYLPGADAFASPELPLNAAGALDLRYYRAMLADLRAATSENQARYGEALKSIQPALDLYCELALEAPHDPKRLLDAARARVSFARLLAKAGRGDAAGDQAQKALRQIDRLAVWPGFDTAPLPPMRCDALRMLARQAHDTGDFPAAVRWCQEMLAACETLPAGLLVRPENEPLPRLALGAYDLATHAIAAGPSWLPDAKLRIDHATALCRTALERDPGSFPLACGLVRCLHASARISLRSQGTADLRPLFKEAADLMLGSSFVTRRTSLPLIWELSVTATGWAGGLLDHPDPAVPADAVRLAQRFTVHVRRKGDTRECVLFQGARIHLYQSRLACRAQNRKAAVRPISMALGLLRPRQLAQPDQIPLALLTAAALHQAKSLADFPETRWDENCAIHLDRLLEQLAEEMEELTPDQRLELASLK